MKATGNFQNAQAVDPMLALTDATRAKAGNVGLAFLRRLRADVVGIDVAGSVLGLADRPGQVVVAVEEDALREDFLRVVERGIGCCRRGNRDE